MNKPRYKRPAAIDLGDLHVSIVRGPNAEGRWYWRALADRAYTLFLVGSDSDSAVLAVWCEDPSPTLDPLSARCVHARLGR